MKVKDFIEFIKLPPNILAAVSVVAGIILFIPDKLAKKMYIYDLRNDYGVIVSIVFLISFSILIVLLTTLIYKKNDKNIKYRLLKKKQIKYLLNAEKSKVKLLKNFIKAETHTLQINQNDGLTVELAHFGFISMAGSTQAVDFGYNNEMYVIYFLQPWVINLINENDELKKIYM